MKDNPYVPTDSLMSLEGIERHWNIILCDPSTPYSGWESDGRYDVFAFWWAVVIASCNENTGTSTDCWRRSGLATLKLDEMLS